MNNGISKDDFIYDIDKDVLIIDRTVDMNITGENFYKGIKEQILNNQAIVNRLQQVIDDYKMQVWESPTIHRMVVKHLEEIMANSNKHSKCSRENVHLE